MYMQLLQVWYKCNDVNAVIDKDEIGIAMKELDVLKTSVTEKSKEVQKQQVALDRSQRKKEKDIQTSHKDEQAVW